MSWAGILRSGEDSMSDFLNNETTAEDSHLLTSRSLGRGGFWETRTRCERRLVIMAVILAVFIVILVVVLAILEEEKHKLSDYRLQKLTEELIAIDKESNNVFDQLDIHLPGPKLLQGPPTVFTGPTIAPLVDLQYDFHPDVNVPEIFNEKHMEKQERFLAAIMDTAVMKRAEKVLKDTDLIKKPLIEVLEDMWFDLYSRSVKGINGSSGFEHVFVGETTKKKDISGFHNWVYFFQEQNNPGNQPNLTYKQSHGMLRLEDKGVIINMDFKWLNKTKSGGSMFIGTSPELEMAVYTICFLARPNKDCPVSMAGKNFNIKTFTINDTMLLGTAYPNM